MGLFADCYECHMFIMCYDGVLLRYPCPGTQRFSVAHGVCRDYADAVCGLVSKASSSSSSCLSSYHHHRHFNIIIIINTDIVVIVINTIIIIVISIIVIIITFKLIITIYFTSSLHSSSLLSSIRFSLLYQSNNCLQVCSGKCIKIKIQTQ